MADAPVAIDGEIAVPGDKSITHRALMLAAAARGTSRVRRVLAGADCRSTADVLRRLGCDVPELDPAAELVIAGPGLAAWHEPRAVLDCGNSGTTARLMLGLLAGRPFCASLTGDASLRSRPMRRITEPLAAMGAGLEELEHPDRLPLRVCGGALRPLQYASPKASAQIKSAVLLAGLSGGVPVSVREPGRSRDHTERLLRSLGVDVSTHEFGGGWEVHLAPPHTLPPLDLTVPGDPSSAAFVLALALLADYGELRIRGVGVNPTRTGFFRALARMGAFVELHDEAEHGGEPVADLLVRPAELVGTSVGAAEVPELIDEIPVLAVLAARARGETVVRGAAELRVKESDRIAAVVANLRAIGAEAEELPDGLVVRGGDRPLAGRVVTHGDHRIAMAFGVLAALPGNRIEIDDPDCVDVSFPGFWPLLRRLLTHAPRRAPRAAGRRGIVVAIDGPAGSGKSSTARAVARRLGYRHLDSGAYYRALTLALLRAGLRRETWGSLAEEDLEPFSVEVVPDAHGSRVLLDGEDVTAEIRSARVNAAVSAVAALPAVRRWLLDALQAAGRHGALVADGRDIGTVVFPDAELKVFLVASPVERARRRLRDHGVAHPSPAQLDEETARLAARDELDSSRAHAPLARAADAVLLDTTALSFDQQVDAIVDLARERLGG